ncbi:hypothetical protein Q3G72_017318 [Acer saccharum]|nr:hypothetical protein Q3G72_017318 [Acer saccharum]
MANANEIKRKERVCQPAHFTLEIKSYSLLSNARSGDNYKSGWFSAGNYKWRLILYLKEIKGDRHGNGHISLSLAIDKPTGKNNWRILVNFKLFMLDRLKTRYVIIQDDTDEFHEKQTQRDFPKFLSLKEFKLRSNGKFFIFSKDNRLHLDMELVDQKSVEKVYAEYKLRVKNLKGDNKFVKECGHWFKRNGRFQDVITLQKNICPKEYLKNVIKIVMPIDCGALEF